LTPRQERRDPTLGETWQRERFPAIARQAKASGGEVYFWDESGFRADTVHGKTWGECRAERRIVVTLLQRMMRPAYEPSPFGARRTAGAQDRAGEGLCSVDEWHGTLHFLPGYAPELNPDELLRSHMKRTGVARAPLPRGEKLQEKIEAQLGTVKLMPQLLRSFFKAPSVAYITDR
jgi:hypothetical protein